VKPAGGAFGIRRCQAHLRFESLEQRFGFPPVGQKQRICIR
jgi:hypothetical protein